MCSQAQENDKTSERTQLEINNLRQEIASREVIREAGASANACDMRGLQIGVFVVLYTC